MTMKRVFTLFFLFVAAIGAWADGAKVAMLTGFGTNNNVDVAKTWFDAANNIDRDELSITTTPFTTSDAATLAATYSVIWIYMDGLANIGDYPSNFTDTHVEKLRDYVKAGGNLLLTGQASKLAWKIGRAPQPNEYSNSTSSTTDVWGVTTKIWRDDNNKVYDHSSHPLFAGVTQVDGYFYQMVNASNRSDNNCMWKEEANVLGNVPDFEIQYNCAVLGTWQQESSNYSNAGIVEFQPMGDYKGRVIAIGVAAYQWASTSNTYLDNVKNITTNGLNYLKNRYETSGQTKVAYLLPVNLNRTDSYTTTEYQAAALNAVDQDDERTALQWFIDEIVSKGKGTIMEPKDLADLDPNIITTVWVNIDRDGDNAYPATGWSVLWQENMKQLLKRYVSNAGRLLLTKHAVQLVQQGSSGGMGRCDVDPWVTTGKVGEGTIGIKDNEDPWAINAVIGAGYVNETGNYVSYQYNLTREKTETEPEQGNYAHVTPKLVQDGDHRNDPLYFNVRTVQGEYPIIDGIDITIKDGEANDKYEVFYLVGRGVKEDHNCLWDGINAANFQNANNCVILGQWGHLSQDTNAAIVKFNSTQTKGTVGGNWEGEILTIGLAAYEWQPSNSDGTARSGENPYLNDIKQLTYNALNLLDAPEVVETYFDYTYGDVTYELHTRGVLNYAVIKSATSTLQVYDLTTNNGNINKGQVTFPGDGTHEAATYNITNIAEGAFTGCTSLAYADLMDFQGVIPTNLRACFPNWTIVYLPREEVTTMNNCEVVGENIVNTIRNSEKTADIKVSEKLKVYDNEAGDTYVYHLFANKYEFTANAVEFNRSFDAVKSTICLPFAVSADETSDFGQFYAFDKVNGDDVRFAAVSSTEAYKPYMFEPSTNGTVISINAAKTIGTLDATPTFENDKDKYILATTLPQNWYDDAAGKGANFIGEFRPQEFSNAKSLGIYSYKSDGTFKTTTITIYADPFRAYLKLNTPPSTAKVFRAVFEDFTPTGIFNANADEETNDGAYYTLQGIKVSNPGPGIYIHNKKKIIIKK